MWLDHVEQGDDDEQEDGKARERARAKGKERKAKEETQTQALEDSKENAVGAMRDEMGHRSSKRSKKTACLKGNGRHSILFGWKKMIRSDVSNSRRKQTREHSAKGALWRMCGRPAADSCPGSKWSVLLLRNVVGDAMSEVKGPFKPLPSREVSARVIVNLQASFQAGLHGSPSGRP